MSIVARNTLNQVEWSETGISIPEDTDFEQWQELGRNLRHIEKAIQWAIGDWLNFGERKWGDTYAQAVLETGKSYSTLTKYASVAARFEVFRRRQTLPWSHHAAVVGLTAEEREAWLDRAEADEWSEGELRGRLRNKSPEEAIVTMPVSRKNDLEVKERELKELKAEQYQREHYEGHDSQGKIKPDNRSLSDFDKRIAAASAQDLVGHNQNVSAEGLASTERIALELSKEPDWSGLTDQAKQLAIQNRAGEEMQASIKSSRPKRKAPYRSADAHLRALVDQYVPIDKVEEFESFWGPL